MMTKASYVHNVRKVRVRTRERYIFDLPRRGPLTDGVGNTGKLEPDEWEPEDLWVEVDVADCWRAAFRLMSVRGKPVVAEVRLFPRDDYPKRPGGQWRAEVLGVLATELEGERTVGGKKVSFPPLGNGIDAQLLRRIPFSVTSEYVGRVSKPVPQEEQEKPRKKGALPEHFYAKLAAAYVARLKAGSRRPLADLARRRKLSYEQIRDAIHTARNQLSLLTKSRVQGQPGGQLTEKAEKLLEASRSKKKRAKK